MRDAAHPTAIDRPLVDVGHALRLGGLVRGRSGNLSARDGSRTRIAAAGARLARLQPGWPSWPPSTSQTPRRCGSRGTAPSSSSAI